MAVLVEGAVVEESLALFRAKRNANVKKEMKNRRNRRCEVVTCFCMEGWKRMSFVLFFIFRERSEQ